MCGVPRRGVHRGQQAGADGAEMSPVTGSVICLHIPFICPHGGQNPMTSLVVDSLWLTVAWTPTTVLAASTGRS